MKLLILHGPAKAASRKKLIEEKLKFDTNNVVVFEEGSDLQTILGSLATPSLFSDQQLIILENPPEDFTNYTLYPNPCTLILWFDHQVSEKKPITEWVRKLTGEIYFFPESKEVSVFPFLDYLAAKDNRAFLELNKLKMAGFDIHYFITMVFYLLRNLLVTPKNVPRKNFTQESITNLYKDILEIDFKIKSGLLEKPQAEFLLINEFLRF